MIQSPCIHLVLPSLLQTHMPLPHIRFQLLEVVRNMIHSPCMHLVLPSPLRTTMTLPHISLDLCEVVQNIIHLIHAALQTSNSHVIHLEQLKYTINSNRVNNLLISEGKPHKNISSYFSGWTAKVHFHHTPQTLLVHIFINIFSLIHFIL